jgi:exonuclease III
MSPWTITHANSFADVLSVVSWNVNEGLSMDCTSNLLQTCRYLGNKCPDIMCLQDIPGQMIVAGTHVTTYIEFIRLYVNAMYHIRYYTVTYGGLAILSKYPVTNSGEYFTPDHAIYTHITINNQNYKIINCRLARQSTNHVLTTIPFTQTTDADNKLPIHDMYSDLLNQCYNNCPVIMCGRFTAWANPITKSQLSPFIPSEQQLEYDNIITNSKWCKKITMISAALDYTAKNSIYSSVYALVGLANQ